MWSPAHCSHSRCASAAAWPLIWCSAHDSPLTWTHLWLLWQQNRLYVMLKAAMAESYLHLRRITSTCISDNKETSTHLCGRHPHTWPCPGQPCPPISRTHSGVCSSHPLPAMHLSPYIMDNNIRLMDDKQLLGHFKQQSCYNLPKVQSYVITFRLLILLVLTMLSIKICQQAVISSSPFRNI